MTVRDFTRLPFGHLVPVLVVGTAMAASLWWVGAGELAWLGFLLAAMTWPGSRPVRRLPAIASGGPSHLSLSDLPDGVYDVLPRASHVEVRARKLRLYDVGARLDGVTGRVLLHRGRVTAEAEVRAATFSSGNTRRDLHVLGRDFFDGLRHPTLRFVTDQADPAPAGLRLPDGPSTVSGLLEARGTQVPVVWTLSEVTADLADGRVWLRARTSVRRSDFGMRALLWLASDEVGIDVTVAARKAAQR